MDLIDELLERDAGTVNSTIIGKLHPLIPRFTGLREDCEVRQGTGREA